MVKVGRLTVVLIAVLVASSPVAVDVIMTPEAVDLSIETMTRLRQQIESSSGDALGEALFQLGAKAEILTQLINDEVAAHGAELRELIERPWAELPSRASPSPPTASSLSGPR